MDSVTNDTKLWEDFKNSDEKALSAIYHLYVNKLFRYGKKFTSDDELIKDVIQDLFFDLIRNRKTLGSTNHILFYLIKSLRRRLFEQIKSADKIRLTNEFQEIEANIIYSVEYEYIQKEHLSEREQRVRQSLAQLSPKQREILYYRYTCDFDYEQICQIMPMKYDSARKMVFRALKALREQLTDPKLMILFFRSGRSQEK